MEIEIFFAGNKKVYANVNGKTIETDQPISAGGDDTASTPFDIFLASIGTCAGIYVKGFCDNRGISTEGIRILQKMQYNKETQLMDRIDLEIQLPSDFPLKYKDSLINVANLCKVKKHLYNPPQMEITTKINE